jgi:hypothetical protein
MVGGQSVACRGAAALLKLTLLELICRSCPRSLSISLLPLSVPTSPVPLLSPGDVAGQLWGQVRSSLTEVRVEPSRADPVLLFLLCSSFNQTWYDEKEASYVAAFQARKFYYFGPIVLATCAVCSFLPFDSESLPSLTPLCTFLPGQHLAGSPCDPVSSFRRVFAFALT